MVNNGHKLFISQMPDVTYQLGSSDPIDFFTWNNDEYDITVTTDSPTYIDVVTDINGKPTAWKVIYQSVASKLITYTATTKTG